MSLISDPIILLIDRDAETRTTMCTALECESYDVLTASDAPSAIDLAAGLELDLVICELNVDGQSGIEIYRQITSQRGGEFVPVIFTSTSQHADVLHRAHEFGAAFHLRKPVDGLVLTEVVSGSLWMPHLIHNQMNQSTIPRPHMPMPVPNHGTGAASFPAVSVSASSTTPSV